MTKLFANKLDLSSAASLLRAGEIIIYPTETFFGIGGLASSPEVLASIYKAKQRPSKMPLPVIAAKMEDLERLAFLEPEALKLGGLFWPGPLSILVPARPELDARLTAGSGKLAVRITSHPAAAELALAVGEAIFASSANISGAAPVSSVRMLDPALLSRVKGVFDAPPKPAGGLPSTLVEIMAPSTLRVAREGAVSAEQLRAAGFSLASS